MTIGVEYESDGVSEEDVRAWFSDAGYTDVEIGRTQFTQKTHEGWVAQGAVITHTQSGATSVLVSPWKYLTDACVSAGGLGIYNDAGERRGGARCEALNQHFAVMYYM